MNAKQKKRGRPPKPPEELRTAVLFLKLTNAEKEMIDAAANQPSVWARKLILRAARRKAAK